MNTDWIKARQTKYTAYATVYILVVLAVLFGINFLAQRHNKSVDTTTNKRFSLSDQTEKVVKGLKQDVKVTYFDQTSRFQGAKDLLDRYDNLSTKLTVDYVDPYKKPQIARAAGVKTEGTVYVETGGKRQEARSVTEEELTGALIRALKGGERNVCFVSGSGEHSLDETRPAGYSNVKELVERNNYKARAISLLEKPEVPKDCTVLVVGGPKFDYVAPVVEAIKKYVEGGGRALIMLDPPLKFRGDETAENAELTKVLATWGITLNKDLVLDLSPIGQIFGLGPEVPLVSTYESHAIVREMKEVATAFPIVRSLEAKSADKVTAEKLFSSSANSYATSNLAQSPIRIDEKKDKKGPVALAAAASYGQGSQQGRVVSVGSSNWISNGFLRFNGNRDMYLNMLNWLSSDEDLISIRPKEPEDRRLSLNRQQMSTVFYSSVVFLPLAVIAAGIGVWWRRR
jgi:gliding motility-associatede transport system auxiliary component